LDAIITILVAVCLAFCRKKDMPAKVSLPVWKVTGNGVKNENAFMKLYNAIMQNNGTNDQR
jgi:hypothetical protein